METATDTAPIQVKAIAEVAPEEPEPCTVLEGGEHTVFQLLFIPKFDLVVSASYDQIIRVYNLESSGAPVVSFEHSDRIRSVSLLFDDVIASASVDGMIRTWHASTGKMIALLDMQIDCNQVIGLTVIEKLDETRFIVGTATGVLFVVFHESGAKLSVLKRINSVHSKWISGVCAHRNTILTCSLDETLKLRDRETLEENHVFQLGAPVTSMAVNDSLIAAGCSNGVVRIWSNKDGYPIKSAIQTDAFDISSLCILSSDLIYFTGSGCLNFVSLSTNNCFLRYKLDRYPLSSTAVLRDGRMVLGGGFGYSAIVSSSSRVSQILAEYATRTFPKTIGYSTT